MVLLETICLLFVLDMYLYWVHRTLHQFPILWQIHSVHHRAYAPIFHLGEFCALWLIPIILVTAVGRPWLALIVGMIFVYEVVLTHRTVYTTTNKVHRVIFKSFKSILANAKYHKAHHDNPNVNYSQFLNIWDRIMKTQGASDGIQS